MPWTEREIQVMKDISKWEKQQFSVKSTDFTLTYHKGINLGLGTFGDIWSKRMLTQFDNFLFHLQSIVQQGRFDDQTRDHLFTQGRIFKPDIHSIKDMKKLSIDQLRFIAKKQLARQRLTAFAQGGITGLGGIVFTMSDLPLMLALNLRTVQLMAMTYGYDLRRPYEMMFILKVFHAISLPRHLQEDAWENLFSELKSVEGEMLFYEGEEDITSEAWLHQPLNHILKLMILSLARKKVVQGIPILGIAAGAGINYTFARRISEMSHTFYQKRWLLEKNEEK